MLVGDNLLVCLREEGLEDSQCGASLTLSSSMVKLPHRFYREWFCSWPVGGINTFNERLGTILEELFIPRGSETLAASPSQLKLTFKS